MGIGRKRDAVLTSNALCIKDLSFFLYGTALFSRLNISIQAGEVLALLGVNGSGKTTLLEILAGALGGYTGCIEYKGFEASSQAIRYLPTHSILDLEFTWSQQMKFWQMFYGPAQDKNPTFQEKAGYHNKRVKCLSLGWRKKLSFHSLKCGESALWLLDEPFAFLDLEGAQDLAHLIQEFTASGGMVIMASPQPFEAVPLTYKVMSLDA